MYRCIGKEGLGKRSIWPVCHSRQFDVEGNSDARWVSGYANYPNYKSPVPSVRECVGCAACQETMWASKSDQKQAVIRDRSGAQDFKLAGAAQGTHWDELNE